MPTLLQMIHKGYVDEDIAANRTTYNRSLEFVKRLGPEQKITNAPLTDQILYTFDTLINSFTQTLNDIIYDQTIAFNKDYDVILLKTHNIFDIYNKLISYLTNIMKQGTMTEADKIKIKSSFTKILPLLERVYDFTLEKYEDDSGYIREGFFLPHENEQIQNITKHIIEITKSNTNDLYKKIDTPSVIQSAISQRAINDRKQKSNIFEKYRNITRDNSPYNSPYNSSDDDDDDSSDISSISSLRNLTPSFMSLNDLSRKSSNKSFDLSSNPSSKSSNKSFDLSSNPSSKSSNKSFDLSSNSSKKSRGPDMDEKHNDDNALSNLFKTKSLSDIYKHINKNIKKSETKKVKELIQQFESPTDIIKKMQQQLTKKPAKEIILPKPDIYDQDIPYENPYANKRDY